MNTIFRLFSILALAAVLTQCTGDDAPGPEKLRDYQTQYTTDIANVEDFLKTHSYTVIQAPGLSTDQDVVFTKIGPDNTAVSIWDSGDLLMRELELHDITYKIYYLKFREGGGAADDKPFPTNVDAILAAYKGSYMFRYDDPLTEANENELRTSEFESTPFPQANLSLEGVIKGWSEIFPQFRAGDFTTVTGEPTVFTDFGAGAMFLPSGLGYYGQVQSVIPKYSPLIFSFKLYEVTRQDQDQDGVPSYLEDLDGDRYIRITGEGEDNPDNSDPDSDVVPDYLDLDDDGDTILTENEVVTDPVTGEVTYPDCDGDGTPDYRDPDPCNN